MLYLSPMQTWSRNISSCSNPRSHTTTFQDVLRHTKSKCGPANTKMQKIKSVYWMYSAHEIQLTQNQKNKTTLVYSLLCFYLEERWRRWETVSLSLSLSLLACGFGNGLSGFWIQSIPNWSLSCSIYRAHGQLGQNLILI